VGTDKETDNSIKSHESWPSCSHQDVLRVCKKSSTYTTKAADKIFASLYVVLDAAALVLETDDLRNLALDTTASAFEIGGTSFFCR
jgi:hypothetical protein